MRHGTQVGEGPVADVLTLERLSALYGARIRRLTDPVTGERAFLPE
jgi:iron complex transport system ATP-binding protein